MRTECGANEMEFGRAGGRRVVADFDGGMMSSHAGALLVGETDKAKFASGTVTLHAHARTRYRADRKRRRYTGASVATAC
jgi:hypothetical protein